MNMVIDTTRYPLETERLRLRAWRESDLMDFYAYASVPGLGERAGWPHHENLEMTKKALQGFMEEKTVYAIADKETDRVIGQFALHGSWASRREELKHLRVVSIGYALSKDYWGRGLMPEAVRAVVNMLWENDLVDIVTICHFVDNDQSRRVIEKCGFTYSQNGNYYAPLMDKTFNERQYIMWKPKGKNP